MRRDGPILYYEDSSGKQRGFMIPRSEPEAEPEPDIDEDAADGVLDRMHPNVAARVQRENWELVRYRQGSNLATYKKPDGTMTTVMLRG